MIIHLWFEDGERRHNLMINIHATLYQVFQALQITPPPYVYATLKQTWVSCYRKIEELQLTNGEIISYHSR